jgi:hypothetical protein
MSSAAITGGEVTDLAGRAISKGTRVRVPKGTVITGTFAESIKEAKTSRVVVVHRVSSGWEETRMVPGQVAEITWVGSGGYYHSCAASEVEVVSSPDSAK